MNGRGLRGARSAALPLCVLALLAQVAGAQELGGAAAPERRVHLALRSGFGVPLGSYARVRDAGFVDDDVNALADDTHGAIPLWLDAGYRLSPHLMLGGFFMFGIVLPKAAPASDPLSGGCPDGVDCFATGVRFGVQAQYSFLPGERINPWLGLGLGYEWITSELDGELLSFPVDASTSHSGPELLHVQGGADLRLGPALAIGPFASLSAAQYTACGSELRGNENDCDIVEASWHGWLVLGVRGALSL